HRGDLDAAVDRLEAAARDARSVDALYPLALARSERGELDRALETLDRAAALAHGKAPPAIFRALVLYDHHRDRDARESLRAAGAANIIARGLSALVGFREAPQAAVLALPRGARWMAEIAGRLFALVEARLFEAGREVALGFHHEIFA